MSSTKPPHGPNKFTIALLGKDPEFNNTIRHLILSNGNVSVKTMNDFVILENDSFRIISTHDFYDDECPHPDQQMIDFMAHSYDGLHLFIMAIDSENIQIDDVGSQIMKLQGIFGQTVTKHIVVMLDKYKSFESFSHLKETFINIKLATVSEHLVHDCMKWCSKHQLFQHEYRDYPKDIVKRRKKDLIKIRNKHRNHEKSEHHYCVLLGAQCSTSLQSTSKAPAERAPEQYHGESKHDTPETEFNIVLLGLTGTGKSASGNTILTAMDYKLKPRQRFESKPSSTPVTTKCQSIMMSIFGRHVRVVDTPDFFNDEENYQAEVDECKKYCQPGRRCVVLLVIQIGRFTEGERGILERLEGKLGWRIRESTIVLLTHGEDLKGDLQSFIDERSELRHIVKACGGRFHVFKNTNKKFEQVMELFKRIPDYQTIFPEFTEKQSQCCLC